MATTTANLERDIASLLPKVMSSLKGEMRSPQRPDLIAVLMNRRSERDRPRQCDRWHSELPKGAIEPNVPVPK